jgi:hypothetical protein
MRRLSVVIAMLALCVSALAIGQNPAFLAPVRNARFVYVTSYDGPEFSSNLFPEDRQAIGTVQRALEKQGYIIVYRPQEADMIVAVESRPSEDVLAIYDGSSWRAGTYLWRAMGKNGLAAPNAPLVQQLEASMAKAGRKRVG